MIVPEKNTDVYLLYMYLYLNIRTHSSWGCQSAYFFGVRALLCLWFSMERNWDCRSMIEKILISSPFGDNACGWLAY